MPSQHTLSFPSTSSSVSVNSIASTSSSSAQLKPISSKQSLASSSSQSAPKDYSKSLASLQTQFGWGPVANVPIPWRMKGKKQQDRRETRSTSMPEEKKTPQFPPAQGGKGKDYEIAFASLSSQYGIGATLTNVRKESKNIRS